MNKILCWCLVVFFFLLINISRAEERKPLFFLGFYGAYNYNIHIADFIQLPDVPCCGEKYQDGSGTGFSVGALFDYPLNEDMFLGIRFGLSTMSGKLKKSETIGKAFDSKFNLSDPNGDPTVDVVSETTLTSRLYSFGVEPNFTFKLFSQLTSSVGIEVSYLFTSRFDQQEQIVKPNYITFKDGSTVNNYTKIVDKEIPEKNDIQVFGVLGFGYELYISEETLLVPEIRYHLPFTNISSANWKVGVLSIGIAIKMPIMPAKEKPIIQDTVYKRDTTVIADFKYPEIRVILLDSQHERERIHTSNSIIERTTIYEKYTKEMPKTVKFETGIEAIGISREGKRQVNPTIIIEETEVEEQFPLLPQIFFEEGSSELSKTGLNILSNQNVTEFHEENLPWNTLNMYSELLNIIGYRMRQNSSTKINITGCNANLGMESGNLKLSQERADAIKKYLTDIWGINSTRISVSRKNLPDNPSNNQVIDGQVENRRGELSSSNMELLKPIALKDIQRTSNPPVVEILPKINSEAGLKSWQINVNQGDASIRQYKGDALVENIKWNVEDKPLPQLDLPVKILFSASDKVNQNSKAETNISIQQLTIKKKREEIKDDKRIEKFSLIVFDFDKADLKPAHKPILNEIKARIMENSYVTIAGYADRTGDPVYNRELAQRRIDEIQKYLRIPEQNLTMKPVGSDIELFDNNLPQGRSYSRTVQIIIETPIK
jgi:outer membrane protein OmpA-like peptidoglycan-associated protein